MWEFPYASIHHCKWSLHPWTFLNKLWLLLESGSILHGTSYLADVFWGLNWLGPSVWPMSIYRTVQKHGTWPFTAATDVTIWQCLVQWRMDTNRAKRIVPPLQPHQHATGRVTGFKTEVKTSRSFKSVLVWGLHQKPYLIQRHGNTSKKSWILGCHATRASFIRSLVFSLEGRTWQEPEPSHVTGMALAHCILCKFLGVVCHCFPPTFRCSRFSRQVPPSAMTREILAAKGGTVGEKDVW